MREGRERALQWLSLGIAICSLGLSGYLASRLLDAQRQLEPLRGILDSAVVVEDGQVGTRIRIPAGTEINLDVPVDERVAVRVDTVLPLRSRITIPIRSPLGNFDVPVPVRADIPIRAVLPIRVNHTFRLRTQTAEDLFVPIVLGE